MNGADNSSDGARRSGDRSDRGGNRVSRQTARDNSDAHKCEHGAAHHDAYDADAYSASRRDRDRASIPLLPCSLTSWWPPRTLLQRQQSKLSCQSPITHS